MLFTEVSAPAIERNEERRALYQIRIAENYELEQLVFVDEAGCNRITTKRSYAWALLGWRARRTSVNLGNSHLAL